MRRLAILALLLSVAVGLPAGAAGLLKRVAVPKSSPPQELAGTMPVALDVEALVAAGPGGQLDFVLPSGRLYTITMEKVERAADGQLTWTGFAGTRDYRVYGATGPGGSYARIETPEGSWGLVPGKGFEWLFDVSATQANLPPSNYGNDALEPPAHLVNGGRPVPKASGDPTCPDVASLPTPQTTIDVLFVVTNGFRAIHGSNYVTRIDFLVNGANSYYTASNIAITLRRAGIVNVTIDETIDDSTLLDSVTNGAAPFNNIAAIRKLTGADMVALVRNTGSTNSISGVAWVGGFSRQAMGTQSPYMYSINGDAPVFDATLFAHELGHNMGNNHDRANAGSSFGATSYAYGYVLCGTGATPGCPTLAGFNSAGTGWGTIMAYYRPSVPRFASPNYMCTRSGGLTATCGVADPLPATPTPDNTGRDTVRSMNCMRLAIANFFPDSQGCADAADSDNDGIPNCVEARVSRVNGTRDNDVFGSNQLFTMQQYRDFLSREADPDGLNGWMSALAGGMARNQVIDAFFNSAEFNGLVAPVVRLYFGTFLRVPDYAGLTFNAGLVRNGTITLTQLADFFTTSPEFQALYGSLNNTQFVTLLYNNVLGRAPDTAGLNGWVSFLGGGMSRGQVLLGFTESTEYKAAKFNEVYVTMMYVGMLRRSPDPGGYNGWLAYLNTPGNTPLAMINGFFLSTEYHNRFLP
jgi:hypothetical protein